MQTAPQNTFGQVAIELGFVTPDKVVQAVALQRTLFAQQNVKKRLGELLLEKGWMSVEQVQRVYDEQGKRGVHAQIAGYKVIQKIGQGAMGTVFKAHQVSMDRVVAVKVLSPNYAQNDRFVERFFREARAVAKLNHPNIIQGIDVGVSNGVHYFAMEYIDGPTVGQLLKRGGALDEKRSINVVLQIARALDHAHRLGLVHRDIKPENVMLTRQGIAKLCDLGLAKLSQQGDSNHTDPGASMGTPNYISPEQARGSEEVDIRADIYSLGATFYHMVVGEVPFPSENAAVAIAKHLTEEPTPPRERNPLVSPDVSFVVLKMMAKDKAQRYQIPAELVADLERITAGEPVAPVEKPTSVRPRHVRMMRGVMRRRWHRR